MTGGLGRRQPTSWDHVRKYPIRPLLARVPFTVEDALPLPRYRIQYNQRSEGSCVGFSLSWAMSILNRQLYHAPHLYVAAQAIDEWEDTPPEEGTSVRAGCDVLRQVGHWRRIAGGKVLPADMRHGIHENRWATSVDELRECIFKGIPFVLGINWYAAFSRPTLRGREYWIGDGHLGRVVGGHAICGYAASDKRQAFKLTNSWGMDFPLTWVSYELVQRLLNEDGEAALIVDRN